MWIWIFFALFLLPKRSSFLRVPAWRYSRTLQSSASAISSDTAIVIVERNDHQQRLDRFLASLNDKNIKYSRSFIASLCEQGKVWVNGRCRSKSYRVEEGDNITFAVDRYEQNLKLEPEEIPLDILYEDPYVIAINKLSGMVVHPAPGTPNGTFVNALLFHLGNQSKDLLSNSDAFDPLRDQDIECDTTNQSEPTWEDIWRDCSDPGDDDDDDDDNNKDNFHDGQQDNIYEDDTKSIEELTYSDDLIEWKADQECNNLLVREKLTLELPDMPITKKSALTYLRPGIVHRLDKGTTGVLIAGKSAIAVEKMGKLFAERKLRKIYLAICIGYPGDTSIYKNIGRSPKNRQLMTVTDENHGKHAITHIRTLAFDGKLSVCLVRIETGRTHQIRVHLQDRKTPILGDESYGHHEWNKRYRKSHNIDRPLLHAYELEFSNPFDKESKPINIRAPVPQDMKVIIESIDRNMGQRGQSEVLHPILSAHDGVLLVDTVVPSHDPINPKNTGISATKGFLPLNSVRLDEEDWTTTVDLPLDEAYFQ